MKSDMKSRDVFSRFFEFNEFITDLKIEKE
jgi:hypothetical protein